MKIAHISLGIPDDYPQAWLEVLRSVFQETLPSAQISRWQPGDAVSPADYALVWQSTQAFIDAHPQLKAIFNLGAGVDGVLKLTLPADVPLIRLEDCGMAAQMAGYVSHAVLRHCRGLDRYEADANTGAWKPRKALDRADFPVGVMGLGVLGTAVTAQLQALGLTVSGWSQSAKTIAGVSCYVGQAEFQSFLNATRILVNLLPLTPSTRGILSADTLSQLQQPGYVINVARGAHLQEASLIPMIDSGVLAGACLDVFECEPLPSDHAFWAHPKVVVTPHISAQTLPKPSFRQIADKITRLQAGLAVSGVVNRVRGY